ncbi:hypothetical protein VNX24_22975 [Citrobacter farmeri]|uniref:hypothetical protein n=1 Tax=Citrobacter farmeri TaxID=67824 RepID=UPI002AB4CE5F|nr:hypothetical protein [Citrobacter farmeri]MEC3934035.1 hypothetical protein [Citrobacter farmeri]HCD2001347.1 hypothetical protein [Citrobacter farmeri]HEM7437591.1 hypothetical protein [Citrobacter amalonaticus]
MFKRGLIQESIHATSLPLQGIQLHTDLFKIVPVPMWLLISETVKIPLSEENTGVINGKLNEFISIGTFTVSTGTFKFPAYQK